MAPTTPDRFDWPSTIGNFILNFGALELAVLETLKRALPEARWGRLAKLSFHERVHCLRRLIEDSRFDAHRADFLRFFERLEPMRDLRNHLAHAVMTNTVSEDLNTCTQALKLPHQVSGLSNEECRGVCFEELFQQLQPLADLTSELIALQKQSGLT